MSQNIAKQKPTPQPLHDEVIDDPSKDNSKKRKKRKRKKRISYKQILQSILMPKIKKTKPFTLPEAVHFKKVDKI